MVANGIHQETIIKKRKEKTTGNTATIQLFIADYTTEINKINSHVLC